MEWFGLLNHVNMTVIPFGATPEAIVSATCEETIFSPQEFPSPRDVPCAGPGHEIFALDRQTSLDG